ncbi:MAG: hypothetical protein IPH44_09760 [Myxococcales bacterium]|nr:hypothetical protein [Myxococcales bacterium]MBK7198832.1 hypothetical protein [Myxococcales bacterium]MBP6844730.1 hypothetical protein [Kofleriaceae bacterium]
MKLAAPLAVLVAVGACGSPPSPAAPRNAPTVADPDDALVGTWVLHYELTSITEDYSPDSPEADAEGVVRTREAGEVACTQTTTAAAPWRVVALRCDPEAGMFGAREALEGRFAVGAAGLWELGDDPATGPASGAAAPPAIAQASPAVDSFEVKGSRCATVELEDGSRTRCYHPRRGLTWVEVVWNQGAGLNGSHTAELVRVDPVR